MFASHVCKQHKGFHDVYTSETANKLITEVKHCQYTGVTQVLDREQIYLHGQHKEYLCWVSILQQMQREKGGLETFLLFRWTEKSMF